MYSKLKHATKAEIIEFLIPMIERAVKINECWIDGREGVHPTDESFDEMNESLSFWEELRDLHDEYGDEVSLKPNVELSGERSESARWHSYAGGLMLVIATGKQDMRVLCALAAHGVDVATTNTFKIKSSKITCAWIDELSAIAPEPHRAYGPPVKGRGGKVKRW